jgi:predicted DNA-binding transcriptional regulator YafY
MRKPQNSVYSWPAIERMMRIHQLIVNKEYPNCSNIAEEFEMSVRTVKRDVGFMKTRLNMPIEFDVRRNGYFFTESVPHFPQMPMSEADTFALFIASNPLCDSFGHRSLDGFNGRLCT